MLYGKGDKNMKLLWELEQNYLEKYNDSIYMVENEDLTIRELLDLGFNNNYIKIGDNKYNLGYALDSRSREVEGVDYKSEDFDLTDKQLDCEIAKGGSLDTDWDGFTIITVRLKNEEDKKYFLEGRKK
jgi:hypothetical protein